jgi:hypothetical protein
MPRTALSASPNDARMWRRVLLAQHPDRGRDHETYIWLGGVTARTSVEVRAASVGGGVLAESAYCFTTGRSKKGGAKR